MSGYDPNREAVFDPDYEERWYHGVTYGRWILPYKCIICGGVMGQRGRIGKAPGLPGERGELGPCGHEESRGMEGVRGPRK